MKNYFREYRARSKGGEAAPSFARAGSGSIRVKTEPKQEQEGDLGAILASHNANLARMGSSSSVPGPRYAAGEEVYSTTDERTESEDEGPISRQGSGFVVSTRGPKRDSPFRASSFSGVAPVDLRLGSASSGGFPVPTVTTGGRSSSHVTSEPAHRLLSATTTGDMARAFSHCFDPMGRSKSMTMTGKIDKSDACMETDYQRCKGILFCSKNIMPSKMLTNLCLSGVKMPLMDTGRQLNAFNRAGPSNTSMSQQDLLSHSQSLPMQKQQQQEHSWQRSLYASAGGWTQPVAPPAHGQEVVVGQVVGWPSEGSAFGASHFPAGRPQHLDLSNNSYHSSDTGQRQAVFLRRASADQPPYPGQQNREQEQAAALFPLSEGRAHNGHGASYNNTVAQHQIAGGQIRTAAPFHQPLQQQQQSMGSRLSRCSFGGQTQVPLQHPQQQQQQQTINRYFSEHGSMMAATFSLTEAYQRSQPGSLAHAAAYGGSRDPPRVPPPPLGAAEHHDAALRIALASQASGSFVEGPHSSGRPRASTLDDFESYIAPQLKRLQVNSGYAAVGSRDMALLEAQRRQWDAEEQQQQQQQQQQASWLQQVWMKENPEPTELMQRGPSSHELPSNRAEVMVSAPLSSDSAATSCSASDVGGSPRQSQQQQQGQQLQQQKSGSANQLFGRPSLPLGDRLVQVVPPNGGSSAAPVEQQAAPAPAAAAAMTMRDRLLSDGFEISNAVAGMDWDHQEEEGLLTTHSWLLGDLLSPVGGGPSAGMDPHLI